MMPNPREPQPLPGQQAAPTGYPPPGYPAPGYAAPNPYYTPPVTQPQGGVFGRTIRLLFRRWLRLQLRFWRWVGSRIGWVLTVLALLGVIGWMSVQLVNLRRVTPVDARTAAIAPASTTESYLKGQQNFNADQMWNSYSTTYQSAQIEKGFSKENLQLRADTERNGGLKYLTYEYIGASEIDGGGGNYYYTVKVEYQGRQIKVPIIFTVDADGKIGRVYSPLIATDQ